MECQSEVFAEASFLDECLGLWIDGVGQNHKRHERRHMLLVRLDVAHAGLPREVNFPLQILCRQVIRQINVDILIILDRAQNVLLADEIVLIAQIVERRGGEVPAFYVHVPFDVVMMRIGIEQLGQSVLLCHLHRTHSFRIYQE